MKFLRNMDLYKAIVLLSLLLLPLGGWWCSRTNDEIDLCKKSITDATRSGGLLEQIGSLQKKVEVVAQNKRTTSDAINIPRTYFQGQIIAAASGGGSLKTNDFGLTDPKEEPATLGGGRQRAADFVVDVTWNRDDFTVSLPFVYAVLFNCESGAHGAGQGNPSIWKLRELHIVNSTDERLITNYKTPPPELSDNWVIKSMKFARREPRKGT